MSSTPAEPSALAIFALREDFADIYDGGIIFVDGGDYDVAQALAAGDGTIKVRIESNELVQALVDYPALERLEDELVDVPDLDDVTVDDLKAAAKMRGLHVSGTKAELAERIREHDAEAAQEPEPEGADPASTAGDEATTDPPQEDAEAAAAGDNDTPGASA